MFCVDLVLLEMVGSQCGGDAAGASRGPAHEPAQPHTRRPSSAGTPYPDVHRVYYVWDDASSIGIYIHILRLEQDFVRRQWLAVTRLQWDVCLPANMV